MAFAVDLAVLRATGAPLLATGNHGVSSTAPSSPPSPHVSPPFPTSLSPSLALTLTLSLSLSRGPV